VESGRVGRSDDLAVCILPQEDGVALERADFLQAAQGSLVGLSQQPILVVVLCLFKLFAVQVAFGSLSLSQLRCVCGVTPACRDAPTTVPVILNAIRNAAFLGCLILTNSVVSKSLMFHCNYLAALGFAH
jgi:hypothetical protein